MNSEQGLPTRWENVTLGEAAKPVIRGIAVVPGQAYRTLGVRWWGEGAYERDTIDGSATAAKQLFEVHEDDLIINKIWVRHGSIGLVPAEMHGCVGSNEFPTFVLDRERVVPRWLYWMSKTRDMWRKCAALSQGTSGKNRIKPEKFLTITIPLPPLAEQRRIVAKIDALAAKIEEAQGLRRRTSTEVELLAASASNQVFDHDFRDRVETRPLGEVSEIRAGVTLGRQLAGATLELPYLRVANVQDAHLDLSLVKSVSIRVEEHGKWRLENGDLLLTQLLHKSSGSATG